MELAQRGIASNVPQQPSGSSQFARLPDIIPRQHCTVLGGAQFGMADANIARKIGFGAA